MSLDESAVQRAAETVYVVGAADAAEDHGRPVLAWFLRRFAAYLRASPIE